METHLNIFKHDVIQAEVWHISIYSKYTVYAYEYKYTSLSLFTAYYVETRCEYAKKRFLAIGAWTQEYNKDIKLKEVRSSHMSYVSSTSLTNPTLDRETLRVPHTTPGLRDGSPVGVTTQPKLLKPGRMMKG